MTSHSALGGPFPAALPHLEAMTRFTAALRFEDLVPALIAKAKLHLLDTLGAALAGTRSAEFRAACQLATGDGARLLGRALHASPRDAALINGVAAHVFELDDSGGCDHSGAVVVPALLAAMGSGAGTSGRDLICALLAGYEVGRRILDASGGYGGHNGAGWHSTGTCGTLAAAAAVSRLRGYGPQITRHAVTLSTSFSSGLWAFIHDGSQAKKIHAGRAAEGGLLAADLAGAGLTGPSQVFEEVWGGFFRSFIGQPGRAQEFSDGLGQIWKINRVSLKPYAACRGAHSAVDALGDSLAQTGHSPEQITRIDLRLSQFLMDMCGTARLDTLAGAQMSLAYVLAARCVFGAAGLAQYAAPVRRDPRLAAVMAKVRFQVDPALAQMDEPVLTLTFADGQQITAMVPRATGAPERPMAETAVLAKFTSLAGMALPEPQVAELLACVNRLETLDSCDSLVALLTHDGPQRPVFD